MNNFNWFKAVGYGVLIWGIASIALWVLALTTLSVGWTHGIVAIVFGVTAYLFAINAKPENVGQAFGYGVVFAAIGLAMDFLFMRNFDAHIFASWQYWVGYTMVLLAPILRTETTDSTILHRT